MRPFRCLQSAHRWLLEQYGGAALMAALFMVALGTWGLLSGGHDPEPGTWGHAALSLVLGTMALVTAVLSHWQRKQLEKLKREAHWRSSASIAQARVIRAEADRLLLHARANYVRKQKMSDRRT